jgi:hypothetical protein
MDIYTYEITRYAPAAPPAVPPYPSLRANPVWQYTAKVGYKATTANPVTDSCR